jgi:2,4-dienoyl-CoA reductase-like NADH-dependent reductase (Old Yellow Enzyme family)
MQTYPLLRQPIAIGSVTAPNRLMMTTHGPRLSQTRYLRYLEDRAKGGVGMAGFNLGPLGVMQFPFGPGAPFPGYSGDMDLVAPHPLTAEGRAFYDAMIPTARAWGEAVAVHGVVRVAQLYHPGAAQHSDTFQPVVAASPIADDFERHNPHALTATEIGDLTEAFGLCARRAVAAGYEVIELHSAHGYLPQQFLSPLLNHRSDAYGGDLSRRMAFLLGLVTRAREATGGEVPVGVRLTGPEPEGGLTLADIQQIARALEDAGAAYISLSGGTYAGLYRGAGLPYVAPAFVAPGPNIPVSAAVKAAVSIPVIVSGAITTLDQAEATLAAGQADMVGMVRALMADPRLIEKGFAGRGEHARPCIGGNECHYGRPVACAVNPTTGREAAMELVPVARPKTVLIVGAGPAGIECALSAAARGHRVILADRGGALGGFLAVLARTSQQARFGEYLDYAAAALSEAGIDLRLGLEVGADTVRKLAPDALVLATGAKGSCRLPGGLDAASALAAPRKVGRRVVIAGGLDDHLPPLLAADYFAREGREVILLTEAPMPGQALESASLYMLLARLARAGVEIRATTAAGGLEGGAVAIRHSLTGSAGVIEAIDTLIVADGRTPNDGLAAELRDLVPELHVIGDALSPRRMLHATLDGARLGTSTL